MAAFEDLQVWKRSARLCVDLYQALAECRDRGFKDQITRAAMSVPSNIAEGCERGTDREFLQFLRYAKGSCGELRAQLYIGSELQYIGREEASGFVGESREIIRMLHGLMKSIQAASGSDT